jgi:hypothetical protein
LEKLIEKQKSIMQVLGESLTARRMEEEDEEKEDFSMASELYLAFVIYALEGALELYPPRT